MKNVKYSLEITKKRVASIKESLGNRQVLSKSDKNWLNSQKLAYKKDATNFPKSKLVLIDSLIPLLGYDWKEELNHLEKLWKKRVDDIYRLLVEKKPLPNKLKHWLYHQQNVYHKHPKELDKRLISLLDSLTPVLGRDWKERFRPSEVRSKKILSKLSSALKSKRKPEKKLLRWLRLQRDSYQKNPDSYNNDIKEKLDLLIPYLGYDWKLQKEKYEAIPLEKKVVTIREKLGKNEELDDREKNWLRQFRREHRKNSKVFTSEQIELLNTLNPFLAIPWQEYFKGIPKPHKHFTEWVREIKDQGLPYDLLTTAQKDYLKKQRQYYLKNKKRYPLAKLSALNSLNETLEKDWKELKQKRKKRLSFPKVVSRMKNQLQNNKILIGYDRHLLSRYRRGYLKGILPKERIEQLDTLNPLLGYDWKDPALLKKRKKTFKERTTEIKQLLESGKELRKNQKKWLDSHRAKYQKDPDNYPSDKLYILDKLNPLLQRDWKVNILNVKEKITFEESVVRLRRSLIVGKELTKKQKAWLNYQRRYYKKNDSKMTEKKKTSLDSLNILLGYDWKTYKHER